MKTPIRIEDGCFLVDADNELVCRTESATKEELEQIVRSVNNYVDTSVLQSCIGAIEALSEQIQQMQGMFDDSDGVIAEALEAGDAAMDSARDVLAKLKGE